jgi:hypothetical protein
MKIRCVLLKMKHKTGRNEMSFHFMCSVKRTHCMHCEFTDSCKTNDRVMSEGIKKSAVTDFIITFRRLPGERERKTYITVETSGLHESWVLSAYQEKIPARNTIYAHAQDFSAGDELLLAILKAFIPQSLNKQQTKVFHVFLWIQCDSM